MIDTYHADYSADSFSSLKQFRESIERYAAIRVHRIMDPPKPTRAMILGTALHCMILEPEEFRTRFVCEPDRPARSNADKLWWAGFEEGCKQQDLTVVHPQDWAKLEPMAESILRNRMAYKLLFDLPGVNETPIYWEDRETGVPLKCKPDRLLNCGLILDLKTSDGDIDPEAWSRKVDRFDYHQQAALYCEGAKIKNFAWIVVDTNEPHETAVHECGERSLALGKDELWRTIRELGERQRSGDWAGRYSTGYSTVDVPSWRFKKNGI